MHSEKSIKMQVTTGEKMKEHDQESVGNFGGQGSCHFKCGHKLFCRQLHKVCITLYKVYQYVWGARRRKEKMAA